MKQILALLLLLSSGLPLLRADDIALMEVRIDNQKQLLPVTIELYDADAPVTVENFKKLARKKFYNGLTIHRAFPHTLLQMGDPLTRHNDRTNVGTGGPGYTLAPEIHRKHTVGAVAMARLPDAINPSRMSNGSQFFICLKPMPEYDGKYTVFGHVVSGMEGLQALSALSVDTNDNPMERITIKSLRVGPREELSSGGASGRPWWKPWGREAQAPPMAPSSQAGNERPAKAAHSAEAQPQSPTAAAPTRKPWWKLWSSAKQPAPAPAEAASPTPPKKPWWKLW